MYFRVAIAALVHFPNQLSLVNWPSWIYFPTLLLNDTVDIVMSQFLG